MRLTPAPEQHAFAASVHHLLDDSHGTQWRTTWERLAETGVAGLMVPERWGGLGGTAADLVVVAEALGHHALPGPVIETVAVVPALLAGLADDGPAGKWLPEIAAGRVVATVAAPPWVPLAADTELADLTLVAEPASVRVGHGVFAYPSIDQSRHLTDVRRGSVLAEGPAASAAVRDAIDRGALACAAMLLGAGRALLQTTIAYARSRTQFNRPIGSFQAVQHRLADVAVGLEFARPLLHAAAATALPRDVSAAKVSCAEAAGLAAAAALQVHGAIGYTREHGLGRWLTRVRVLTGAWGTPSQHRARVLSELGKEPR
ncbi:acyl-CoA dehydrogenase family protein [Actinoplanes sp. NPDC051861]|uniref:acyl-CoA dehydrogenase family protein n=1 Tax=Actinoplanes sp. NPDC051861 TaxID=3155170 RepID=UPI0034217D6A